MKKAEFLLATVISLLLIFGFAGCKSYVQLVETRSNSVPVVNDMYVYENDSVVITYSFWSKKGLMSFSVYNKMNVPLYVDWKKSSYIDNDVKLDYWIEEEISRNVQYQARYLYTGPLVRPGFTVGESISLGVSSTVKIERITFIPPKSYYYRSQYYIMPVDYIELNGYERREETRNDDPGKKTMVYERNYDSSAFHFRNYLTLSYEENFGTEFYVDNDFYISSVSQMDQRHFEQFVKDPSKKGNFYMRDQNGYLVKEYPYKKGSSFYFYVPREKRVR